MDKNPIRLEYSNGLSCAIIHFYFQVKGIEEDPGTEILTEQDKRVPAIMSIEVWGPCDIRVRRNPYLHQWIPCEEYHSLEDFQKMANDHLVEQADSVADFFIQGQQKAYDMVTSAMASAEARKEEAAQEADQAEEESEEQDD